jgi:hypothetical protein
VVFRKRPEAGWRVEVAGNTFLSSGAGLRFEDTSQLRRKEAGTQIRVTQNYFLGPGQVSRIDGDPSVPAFLTAEGNFRKRETPPGARPAPKTAPSPKGEPPPPPKAAPPPLVPTEESDVDLSADPGARFLRYKRESPLATAHQGNPVGAPPD